MRLACYLCGKPVSSELDDDTVLRAIVICPECIAKRHIHLSEPPPQMSNDGHRGANDERMADAEGPLELSLRSPLFVVLAALVALLVFFTALIWFGR